MNPDITVWLGLLVDVLTPLVLFVLGFRVHAYVDRLTRLRRFSEVEAAWRLEVFRGLLKNLNEIYCYYTYQGNWLLMSPDDATLAKRESDRLVYMNRFLWSREFLASYERFQQVAFVENRGRGKQFLFRANVKRHRENEKWEDAWGARFVRMEEHLKRADFLVAYDAMVTAAVRDLGIASLPAE